MGPSIGQSFLVLGIITLAVGGLALIGWLVFRPRARRAITHQPGDSSKLPVVPQPHWLLEDNTLVRVGAVPRGGSTLTAVDMSATKPLPAAALEPATAPELPAEALETAPAAEPVPESVLIIQPLLAAEPVRDEAPLSEPASTSASVPAHETAHEAYPVYVPETLYEPEPDADSGGTWPAAVVLPDVHTTPPAMPKPESAPFPLAPAEPPGEPEFVPSPDDTSSDAPELFASSWAMPAAPEAIPTEEAPVATPWLAAPAEDASPASEPATSWGAEAVMLEQATPLPVVEPDAIETAAREEPPSTYGEPSPPAEHQPAVVLWLDGGSES